MAVLADASVSDLGDGRYEVSYVPGEAGSAQLNVQLNSPQQHVGGTAQQHVVGSPFAVTVVGASPTNCNATGSGLVDAVVAQTAVFDLLSRTVKIKMTLL